MSDKENKIGNENQDINENEDVNGNQEYSLDELLGDANDESEKIAEMLKNSETLNSGKEPDLEEFLDEPDNNSGNPELDKALSEFVDESGEENQGEEIEEENEEDALAKKLKEEKLAKVRRIKRVSLVGALTVFVLAVGITAFFLIFNNMTEYVLTYQYEVDGRKTTQKISADDFKFLMLHTQSWDPVSDAMDWITDILAVEAAAANRKLTLSSEDTAGIKSSALEYYNYITGEVPKLKVSAAFVERVMAADYLKYGLWVMIHEEAKALPIDEAEYAAQLDDFINFSQTEYIDAVFKFMILNSKEKAAEAKAAIESGKMTVDEALREFYYGTEDFALRNGFESLAELLEIYEFETLDDFIDINGYDTVHLIYLGSLNHDDIKHLISLKVNEVSDIIKLYDDYFVLFIVESIYMPTRDEIDSLFREIYIERQADDIFEAEYDILYKEIASSIKINYNAINAIDLDELFSN